MTDSPFWSSRQRRPSECAANVQAIAHLLHISSLQGGAAKAKTMSSLVRGVLARWWQVLGSNQVEQVAGVAAVGAGLQTDPIQIVEVGLTVRTDPGLVAFHAGSIAMRGVLRRSLLSGRGQLSSWRRKR